jgi:hypothetical protein
MEGHGSFGDDSSNIDVGRLLLGYGAIAPNPTYMFKIDRVLGASVKSMAEALTHTYH